MKAATAIQEDIITGGALGTALLVERDGSGWWARSGQNHRRLIVDAAVDPALLDEAFARQARVLVEGDTIIGVVQTWRTLTVDRTGGVDATLDHLNIQVRREAIIRDARAFVAIKSGDVEIYGRRVLTRAREVAKVLARMISLN